MAELTFKSPGVSTREIDLSGPSRVGPVGTPAGVIGTSAKGRAFVPLVFANLSEFVAEFGAVGPDKFGPMALREWFSNARAGLYLKVLGVGDGKARIGEAGKDSRGNDIAAGAVKNAGFVVGSEIVNPDTGRVAANPYAGAEAAGAKATIVLGVTDGDATNHGIAEDDTITLTDAGGVTKTYSVVDGGHAAQKATATLTYTARPVADNVITLITHDNITKTYIFKDEGSTGQVVDGKVVVRRGANGDADYAQLIVAINHAAGNNAGSADDKIEMTHNNAGDNNNAGNIVFTQKPTTAAGNKAITATLAAGSSFSGNFVGGGSAVATGTVLALHDRTGSGLAEAAQVGTVAVNINTTGGSVSAAHTFLKELETAMESSTGHDGEIAGVQSTVAAGAFVASQVYKITEVLEANWSGFGGPENATVGATFTATGVGTEGHGSAEGPMDGAQTLTLTQKAGGTAGNTTVLNTGLPQAVTLGGLRIDEAATVNDFTGGRDGNGMEGRTHFLSVLMKESAPSKASARITVAAGNANSAVEAGRTIKVTSADGTSRTYVIVDSGNGGVANHKKLVANDALGNGSTAGAAGVVDGISVSLDLTADAGQDNQYTFLTKLKESIEDTDGHAGKLSVSIYDADGDAASSAAAEAQYAVITQDSPGRAGNRPITLSHASIGNLTIVSAFTGGVGERIFSEAGTGVATTDGIRYANVLRGVLMYPSGVVPSLAASRTAITNNSPVGKSSLKATAHAEINFLNEITATRTIIVTDGSTSRTYRAVNDGSEAGLDFKRGNSGGNAAAKAALAATDFARAVNASTGHSGTIRAVASGSMVTLSQLIAGSAKNTAIATTIESTVASIPSHFEGGADSVPQYAGSTAAFGIKPNRVGHENGGSQLGNVTTTSGKQEFIMILNGHKSTQNNPSALTASFDPQASNYFPNVLNTDPTAIQTTGHYLYTHYDVFSTYATPAGTGNPYLTSQGQAGTDVAMLLSTRGDRNTGSATKANAESFSDRFRTAVSPTIVSQKLGGVNQPLFRLHSLDDGAGGNSVYKITVENIRRSQSDKNRYGTFDLLIRSFTDNDREPVVLERFSSLSLDPNSERFISRIIGDQRLFYDFDKRAGSQKLTLAGKFANNSSYVRVELADSVENGTMDATALPFGFRGPQKLNIDNADALYSPSGIVDTAGNALLDATNIAHKSMVAPPLPMRRNLAVGQTPKKRLVSSLNWGIQFEIDDLYNEPNKNSKVVSCAESWTKYFPDFDQDSLALVTARKGSAAADSHNNNLFTLENIQVLTSSAGIPDSAEWAAAEYRRDGVVDDSIVDTNGLAASGRSRFLNTTTDLDLGSVRRYLKFNLFVAGGFDGTEIFDKEKSALSDIAIMREVDDVSRQGGKEGATAATYMKAIDVLAERSDVDIQLLAIPGIRQSLVTDRAIDAVEERFDAMYIMDAIVYDTENTVVTGSAQKASVSNTVTRFNNRVLDSSFAAAYFPDVILSDPSTGQNIQVPPSVPVLGAFALNDQLAHPWYAPAGFTRGAMANVAETQVKLNRDNLDSLYDVDINPITAFPHTDGVVVFGQKTLLRTQSSLDRVNVRRLLIELRRRVRRVANSFIFEPNREATLARFSAQVNPILRQIQQQQGVDRFLVKIDTTTTTQTDVENNTLRGKIFLQPTRSVEFISLDFVITNAGAEI
tara:strand:+ start:4670 stop:9697 length:5028 start_codon:yes stop_codon:yes gene_type:complete